MSAHATFEVKSWDEATVNEADGQLKMTRASVVFAYKGDVQGQSAMQYLMLYRPDESATVIGLERITGQVGDKSGSFVLEHHGGYTNGVASADTSVVPGSGTGQLAGLRGHGRAVARKDGTTEFTLDYDFD